MPSFSLVMHEGVLARMAAEMSDRERPITLSALTDPI